MANLTRQVPDWGNAGVEPDSELKKSGFKAGYKPPAAYFNWFFNRISLAVKELQGATNELREKSVRVTVDDDTLCFSGGLGDSGTTDQKLRAASFSNLSYGALPESDADTDNWAVTEGDLNVSSELSDQTEKFVAQIEKTEG